MKRISGAGFIVGFLLLLHSLLATTTDAGFFTATDSNDLYAVLGVTRRATKDEIRKAFRGITREHHPDLQETPEAKEAAKAHMVKVLSAYSVLSDDIRRQDYDSFGKVPGEQLNSAEYSAQEIFEYFKQHSPILSKTQQMESLRSAQRILNFRGNRLFLIQVYDDTCSGCRWFGVSWDSYAHSNLVEAGVVEMWRIDAHAPEATAVLNAFGVRYRSEVLVFAVVDGEKWHMGELELAVKSKSNQAAFASLEQFVMGFFYDKQTEVSSLNTANGSQPLLEWLGEDRKAESVVRVLAPPLIADSLVLALALVYDGVAQFRVVPREALLDFIEGYCGVPVEVRDRSGEIVPVPEFLAVSTEQLSNLLDGIDATNTVTDHTTISEAAATVDKSHLTGTCRGVIVGASAALTYRKASAFVKESLPPQHPGMMNITLITGASFYKLCKRHCLMWLRENCDEMPSEKWLEVLQGDYKPFLVGYLCLNNEPKLRSALPVTARNGLAAMIDGDEENIHLLHTDAERVGISEALSYLLKEGHDSNLFHLGIPLSLLLKPKQFNLSRWQYWYLSLKGFIDFVRPFFSNAYPFFIMYLAHKLSLRWNLLGGNADNNNNSNESGNGSTQHPDLSNPATTTTTTTTTTTNNNNNNNSSNSTSSTATKTSEKKISLYGKEDLEAAKDGRGFLLLLFLHDLEAPPALPEIATKPPFTVRLISFADPEWNTWLSQQSTDNTDLSLTDDAESVVVAIRQGKMKATIKPPRASMESWLLDLIDGSITATTPVLC